MENNALKIADTILSQTYAERMEMASWFQVAVASWLEDQTSDYILTDHDFAEWFQEYAKAILETVE